MSTIANNYHLALPFNTQKITKADTLKCTLPYL